MIYLLDVNMLLAAIWLDHDDHSMIEAWLRGKRTVTCPISELGFLGISTGDTFPFRADPGICRSALSEFIERHRCRFIPDDFSPKGIAAQSSRHFSDLYLVELAERHRMKLATLDTRISHPAVDIVS